MPISAPQPRCFSSRLLISSLIITLSVSKDLCLESTLPIVIEEPQKHLAPAYFVCTVVLTKCLLIITC